MTARLPDGVKRRNAVTPATCPDCGRTFRSRQALGGHSLSHSIRATRECGRCHAQIDVRGHGAHQRACDGRPPRPRGQARPVDLAAEAAEFPVPLSRRQPAREQAGPVQWPAWPIERRPFDPDQVRLDQGQTQIDALGSKLW